MRTTDTPELIGSPEVRRAAERLRPDADAAEVAARAAWSVLAEPGDGIAGALVADRGAVDALALAAGGAGLLDRQRGVGARALGEAQARWMPRADPRAVADALTSCRDVGGRMLIPGDDDWPRGLDDLGAHAPLALWVRGDAGALRAGAPVSIVGARAASAYGEAVAGELAGDLAATGAVVISGGAYGIDGAAHRAALGVGSATVAFLAGGVDRAYPIGHQQLFDRIRASGAVISEVPCGAAPTKWRFLQRNRLIAAAGLATVVVEAGWRSGSLNTAGHACALGRPLGAVPGPISSPASAGCHRLLREYDAVCITSAQDVRELWGDGVATAAATKRSDPDETRLLDAMSSRGARRADELARRSGLSVDRVQALLGLLALSGTVEEQETGWRRVP